MQQTSFIVAYRTLTTLTSHTTAIMDAASIEQMNKVRVSLGMAPLPVPESSGPQFKSKDASGSDSESEEDLSTLDKRQAAADSNWQKLEDARKDKLERQKRKDATKKARDAAQRYSKLEGKGLGDASDGEVDTRTWLLQQKKRQRKIDKARKMEEELAEREREMAAEYTSKDLAGVKVGHEADEFDEVTGEQVLTLKDAEIGDESDEDELENAELKAKEKQEARLKLKKKKPDYDPTEQGEARNVLSKYDEEIDGKKQKRFIIDGAGNTAEASRKMLDTDGVVKSKGVKIDLDMLKDDVPVSDYVDPSTIKVKKPKKSKKEKKSRKKADDDEDIFAAVEPAQDSKPSGEDAMDVDDVQSNVAACKKRAFEFDDDDDLQARLAEQRRAALKKRKKMDGAELARQMREEMPIDEDEGEEGGMTIDETTEFVANLKRPEAPEAHESKTPQPATAASPEDDEDEEGDTAMQSYADIDDERATSAPAAEESTTATGFEDEATMSGQGLGASLSMLRKRGLITDPSDANLSERERARNQFLADKQGLIDDFDRKARVQREEERRSGKWGQMSIRDRDSYAKQANEQRERYLNQLLDQQFRREYKPSFELRYTDEHGRSMNQKEAFKQMSHMFHGKGSGKGKTEKRLKRIEDEKKELEKGVLGAGEGGMREVQGREGKRTGRAGVRLQ